jgi:Zn-dependent metalloprotease
MVKLLQRTVQLIGFDLPIAHLLFGDGNSDGVWKQPLVQQDIVAHEATHGFIEHSANLLYLYESGILNEAIADIFACLVEGNWQLGERIIPGGIRRLDAPALSG